MASASSLSFDHNTFASKLLACSGIKAYPPSEHSAGWQYWNNDSASYYNSVVAYLHHDASSKKDLGFRTWYQETSLLAANAGLTVSAKIDYDRSTGDDHILVICHFNAGAQLVGAQVAVQFEGAEQHNFHVSVLHATTPASVPDSILQAMNDVQKNVDYGGKTDNAGRKSFGIVAQQNINACMAAVRKA